MVVTSPATNRVPDSAVDNVVNTDATLKNFRSSCVFSDMDISYCDNRQGNTLVSSKVHSPPVARSKINAGTIISYSSFKINELSVQKGTDVPTSNYIIPVPSSSGSVGSMTCDSYPVSNHISY